MYLLVHTHSHIIAFVSKQKEVFQDAGCYHPPLVAQKDLFLPKTIMAITQNNKMAGTKRKIICFSDFDGTIFTQDTGHILFNAHSCGSERRNILDQQIKTGERSFGTYQRRCGGLSMFPSTMVSRLWRKLSRSIPTFQQFHKFCIDNDIHFNVISAGLKPVLRKVLDSFLGEEESKHIEIVANDAEIKEDGSEWKPVWRHDTELGHEKALSITEVREQAQLQCEDGTIPLIVFMGDSVSDLPAARAADVLFARRGLRLEEHCVENKIAYIAFNTFADIEREVKKIREEDQKKTGGLGKPARFNPSANL